MGKKPNSKMSFEAFLAEAQRLRSDVAKAQVRFFVFLREAERHPQIWATHAATFDKVLENKDIVSPSRYRSVIHAMELVPLTVIEEIGVHGAVRVTEVPEKYRMEALEAMQAIAKETGVPLSDRYARQIKKNYEPPKVPGALARQRWRQDMDKENKKLKRRIRELERDYAKLERDYAKLERENKKLKKQLKTAKAAV